MATSNGRRRASSSDPGPPPTATSLHESALAYLGRTSATRAGVAKALERRIAAWARKASKLGVEEEAVARDVARSKEAIAAVVARLAEVGLIDDRAFATRRVRSLNLAGRSRRAIEAHLASKGAAADVVRSAVEDDEGTELGAALTLARKKRLGPFAREPMDFEARRKALGALARAGFSFAVAERALRMDRESAETLLHEHRRL